MLLAQLVAGYSLPVIDLSLLLNAKSVHHIQYVEDHRPVIFFIFTYI